MSYQPLFLSIPAPAQDIRKVMGVCSHPAREKGFVQLMNRDIKNQYAIMVVLWRSWFLSFSLCSKFPPKGKTIT